MTVLSVVGTSPKKHDSCTNVGRSGDVVASAPPGGPSTVVCVDNALCADYDGAMPAEGVILDACPVPIECVGGALEDVHLLSNPGLYAGDDFPVA